MKKLLLVLLLSFALISCWEKEVNKNIFDKANSWKEINILALGDSITYWYKVEKELSYPSQLQKKLQDNWYKYNIVNLWINWNTSLDLLNRMDDILENNTADMAILTIWWNDWLRRQSISKMKKNILKIINKLEEKKIHIIFVWMELPILFGWDYSSNFWDVYEEIAEEKKLVFYPYFLEWIGLKVENNQTDNIHPSAKWYTVISDNIYDFLEDENLLYKKDSTK